MPDIFSETFLLKSVINSNADAIIALDPKGRLFMWNAGAERLLGWSEDDALSKPVYDFVTPFHQELLERRLKAVRPGRPAASTNLVWKHKTGRQIPTVMSLSPIQGARGETDLVGYSAILRDNSAYENLLQQFQQANALLEKKNSELEEYTAQLGEANRKLGEANEQLKRIAATDGLTGLYNRPYFMRVLKIEFARADRHGRNLAVLFLDLDHFKKVNDTFGHAMGDAVLRGASQILLKSVRQTDYVGRYGGEELVVLMPETNTAQASVVAERIRANIQAQTYRDANQETHITVSIGCAAFPSATIRTSEDLLREADASVYKAKEAGRNRVVVAP